MVAERNRVTRVCIFPGHLRVSGAVRVMVNLAEALTERGIEVDLFLTHPPGSLSSMVPPGVSVTVGRGSNIRSLPALVRYLRARKPDVLLAGHHADNVLSVLARSVARVPTKIVVTVHNDRSVRTDRRRLRLRVLSRAMKIAYRRADALIAVSAGIADQLAREVGVPRKRISVIANPTITRRMLEAADEPVAHRWLSSGKETVVLGVGRLTAQKDFATLVRAFAIVRDQTKAKLLVLGEGEDRQALELLVADLGLTEDVELPGLASNAMAYMKRSSVLASSSRWEGMPGVLIEALAVGTPVVATDCPTGPRDILEGDRYGELVAVGDAEALADGIMRTLKSRPDSSALKARGRWFSAERAAEKYLAVMEAS